MRLYTSDLRDFYTNSIMMYKRTFFILFLFLKALVGIAQFPPVRTQEGQTYVVPTQFDLNRSSDESYVNSLLDKARVMINSQQKQPPSARKDTSILQLYNYISSIFRQSKVAPDSCLFYARKTIEYAKNCRNTEFEVKGLFQQAHYQRDIKLNLEEALRLNLRAYEIVVNADHDPQVLWRICYNLGDLYSSVKEFDKSLTYFHQSEARIALGTGLSKASTNAYTVAIWEGMAMLYTYKKQYQTANTYFVKILEHLPKIPFISSHAGIYDNLAVFYQLQGKYLQAIEYGKKAETLWLDLKKRENLTATQANLASCFLEINDLPQAQTYASLALKPPAAKNALKKAHYVLYQISQKQANWQESLKHFEQYILWRDSLDAKFNAEELYKVQSRFDLEKAELKNKQLEEQREQELLKIHHQNELEKLKASAERQRFLDQAVSEKLERQIETQALREQAIKQKALAFEDRSKQEKLINNLQIKEFQQNKLIESRTRNTLEVGLALSALLGLVLFWYNHKLRTKNKDLEAKNEIIREVTHKIQATEISALRAQMNPHFIFNCLNSIQLYTAQSNTEKATDYLNKFSRLIRLVLENSRSEKVSLENELETLRLYMEMEAMRFRGKVNAFINIAQNVDKDSIQIPPLLLQPFVENAIWHGLMHKEEGGIIRIEVTQPHAHLLRFDITDDGVGREKAAEFKSKSATQNKSFGMKVTAERIELINQLYNTATQVQIIDLKNKQGEATGTKVVVEIPI